MSWSIDELAALLGLPTRTLREYRTMGVIDPPRMQGRVGRYNESHRRRLELVARLQARGYSLAAIRDLCTASTTGQSLEDVLGHDPATAIDDTPLALTTAQLVAAVPHFADERIRRDAVVAGLLHLGRSEGEWLLRSPALLSLVSDAVDAGATPKAALRLIAGLIKGARVQAAALADLLVGELWNEDDPESSTAALSSMGRRARFLLSQSAAALIVDAVGVELGRRAETPGGAGLGALLTELRIGSIGDERIATQRLVRTAGNPIISSAMDLSASRSVQPRASRPVLLNNS